jgi:hypothetical protein
MKKLLKQKINHKKVFISLIILIILILAVVVTYLFIISKPTKSNSSLITFDKTLSNNFVNPHINVRILGKVKPEDEVRIDERDGVGSLTINGINYSLTITLFTFEFDSAIHYESVANIQNDKISNLIRTQDSKDWYMEGFYGWHYSNVLSNSDCTITASGIPVAPPCGSPKIEKENVRFDVTCNAKVDSTLVKDCDEIMKTLEIIIIK